MDKGLWFDCSRLARLAPWLHEAQQQWTDASCYLPHLKDPNAVGNEQRERLISWSRHCYWMRKIFGTCSRRHCFVHTSVLTEVAEIRESCGSQFESGCSLNGTWTWPSVLQQAPSEEKKFIEDLMRLSSPNVASQKRWPCWCITMTPSSEKEGTDS